MTVLEIALVGQCKVFVSLDFVHFFVFPLAVKLISQFFKKCRFFRHLLVRGLRGVHMHLPHSLTSLVWCYAP